MQTNKTRLSLCWGSMDGMPLETFLQAASGAGFELVTLNSVLFEDALASGLSEQDIKKLLDEYGLGVSGIDPLFNWLPSSVHLDGDDAMSRITQASRADIFHIAHVVGCDLVNAPLGLATPDSEQEIVDCFATLCAQAASESLRVSLEFMPFNQVADLDTAVRIVTQANCDNGGIMLDCWHHHRSGGTPDDLLAVPGKHIIGLQLDDAMAEPMDDILEETLNHRLLPGEGCIDLPRLLQNLNTTGANVICDVEVFKDSLRSKTPQQRARAMFESATALVNSV